MTSACPEWRAGDRRFRTAPLDWPCLAQERSYICVTAVAVVFILGREFVRQVLADTFQGLYNDVG